MTDVFRKEYKELTTVQKLQIDKLKSDAEVLYGFIDAITSTRETSLAKTKLEECVMWATKAITG